MKVLVVVDMQNDFIDGSLGTAEAKAILPKVIEKVKEFSEEIVVTLDSHGKNYLKTQEGQHLPVEHCITSEFGWCLPDVLVDELNKKKWVATFKKNTFGSAALGEYLRLKNEADGCINEVVLVGLCTDICVISNALLIKAFLPEVKITVDASCCAGVTPESHENALKAMKMCQINIENWEG